MTLRCAGLAVAASGKLYDANFDPEVLKARQRAQIICHNYNNIHPEQAELRVPMLKDAFSKTGESFVIEPPFHCDYGFNIEIGENFYSNHNLIVLDGAKVTIGDNVFIAPNVGLYTAGHPIDAERRNKGLEYALPITIGNDVWIGAGVNVLPGVTIGSNCVIGAASLVNKDIPSGVVAAGNPCRVLRQITDEDRQRYL